jgi:hypothetical protein
MFLVVVALGVVMGPRAQMPTFTKVSGDPIGSANQSFGAAWADFNEDGFLDMVVAGSTNRVYLNNGNGTFKEVTATTIKVGRTDGQGGGIWGDVNNDGFLDLFFAHSRAAGFFYEGRPNGAFDVQSNAFIANSPGAQGHAWADYDRDGHLDLVLGAGNTASHSYLYRNLGDGSFTRIITNTFQRPSGWHLGVAWGDYDNDGWPDLVIAGDGTPSLLLHNERNGRFTKIMNDFSRRTSNWSVAWGDYDNDGFIDLFSGNNNQRNRLHRNNGDGTFTTVTTGIIATDAAAQSWDCAWGDFDNDGWLDLFVANASFNGGGRDYLYRNNGDGTFIKITAAPVATELTDSVGGGCAWGDYDRDGFIDLFIANHLGRNILYHNGGNTNHWLVVKCNGRVSNRSAIGAKVRVRAMIGGKDFWQLREISGGHGYASQNAIEAHFGLGDADIAKTVRIEWPSGLVQEFGDVDVQQILTVTEPAHLGASHTNGSLQLSLRGGKLLSYTLERSTNLVQWEKVLTITNQTGSTSLDMPADEKSGFFRALENDALR